MIILIEIMALFNGCIAVYYYFVIKNNILNKNKNSNITIRQRQYNIIFLQK